MMDTFDGGRERAFVMQSNQRGGESRCSTLWRCGWMMGSGTASEKKRDTTGGGSGSEQTVIQ
jgi:hypothetical protein